MGGWSPPIPSGFAFVPIQGTGGRWTFFHLIFRRRIAPLHSDLGFRLIGNDSLLLLLVHLCLGDNHTPSHLTSLPQIRPDAHFAKGGGSPPHKNPRLPVEFHLMMSANPLRFSCYRTKGRVTRRTVALPHGCCYLTTL